MCCCDDATYQLGDGKQQPESTPVPFTSLAAGGGTSYAITVTGDVYAWGAGNAGQIDDGRTITARHPVLVVTTATACGPPGPAPSDATVEYQTMPDQDIEKGYSNRARNVN